MNGSPVYRSDLVYEYRSDTNIVSDAKKAEMTLYPVNGIKGMPPLDQQKF